MNDMNANANKNKNKKTTKSEKKSMHMQSKSQNDDRMDAEEIKPVCRYKEERRKKERNQAAPFHSYRQYRDVDGWIHEYKQESELETGLGHVFIYLKRKGCLSSWMSVIMDDREQ